jgi:hypothetical protein
MHYHFPVLAAAQLINVSRPGEEPGLLEATEDMTLWDPALTGRGGAPLAPEKRRAFFDKPSHLEGREIGTDLVWTVHITQSLIDFSTYKLGLPGVPAHIDLVPVLDAQPLQVTDTFPFALGRAPGGGRASRAALVATVGRRPVSGSKRMHCV